MKVKIGFKVRIFVTDKTFLNNFLFEIGKSKHCVLTIYATFTALAFLEQEMTWVVGTCEESAFNNTTQFFIQRLNF